MVVLLVFSLTDGFTSKSELITWSGRLDYRDMSSIKMFSQFHKFVLVYTTCAGRMTCGSVACTRFNRWIHK